VNLSGKDVQDIVSEEECFQIAQESLIGCTQVLKPDYQPGQFHVELAENLQKVESGELDRLAISAPPGHGKSLLCSVMFPIWCLGRDPTRRIIQASYSSDLSEDFSMKARDRVWNDEVFQEVFPNCKIDPGKRGKSQWSLTEGGYYLATGTGGSCTGKRAEILLIDDPHKDWEKSHSPREKEKVWNWFQSTASSRLTKDGKIVIIQTRWAEDDLVGRIKDTNPQDWKFINYPAIRSTEDGNEALCPKLFPLENLKKKKKNTSLRIWLSLYQGRPVKAEGEEMDMDMFNKVEESKVPDNCKWVRGWDLAFTKGRNSSRTASVKLGLDKETGQFYLKDYLRGKWKWKDVKELVTDTAKHEGCIVAIGVGGTQIKEFEEIQEDLRGEIPTSAVKKVTERGNKEARIRNWASKVETGKFNLVNDGSNWENFLYEAHHFPDGKYDDSLDAVSDAYTELTSQNGSRAIGASTPTQIPKTNRWQTM